MHAYTMYTTYTTLPYTHIQKRKKCLKKQKEEQRSLYQSLLLSEHLEPGHRFTLSYLKAEW